MLCYNIDVLNESCDQLIGADAICHSNCLDESKSTTLESAKRDLCREKEAEKRRGHIGNVRMFHRCSSAFSPVHLNKNHSEE